MEKEKDTVFLMALVSVGALIMSGLAVIKQWSFVLPMAIAAILLAILIMFQYKKHAIHLSETIERWAFIFALILFIVSFIYLYKPA